MADGFAFLENQHREAEQLFASYAQKPDDAVARQICELLTLHSELEHRALYPELRRIVDDGDDLADRADNEHGSMRTLIARVEEAPPPDLAPLVDELAREVTAHVRFEESRSFPDMREVGVDGSELARRLQVANGASSAKHPGEG